MNTEMLHPVLQRLLEQLPPLPEETKAGLMPFWEKISAVFKTYERDIRVLEHASEIASEDYEAINKRLQESNLGLDSQLKAKLEELELHSQFPLVNPNPVIRTMADGRISYINDSASKLETITYNEETSDLPALFLKIVPGLRDTGHFQLQSGQRYYLFYYQRFQNNSYLNFYGSDITEQVELQQRAYENFYRLSNFLESTDAIHYIIYKDKTENNFFTSRWPIFFGFNPARVEDPITHRSRLVLPASLPAYNAGMEELERTGNASFRYEVQHPLTGRHIWLEEEVKKKYDPYLNDEVFTGKITDVTANELLKETALESEARFKAITDAMPVMVWVSDEQHRVVYSNSLAREFFGKGLEEFSDSGEFVERVHPSSQGNSGKVWKEKLETHQQVEQSFLIKGPDGRYRFLREIATPRFLPGGRFVGYIGSFFDLTNEYETKQELQKEKRQLELIAANSSDAVIITDAMGRMSYVSPAIRKLLGYEPAELENENIYYYLCDECREQVVPQINMDRIRDEPASFTFRMLQKNGQLIWIEALVGSMRMAGVPGQDMLWHLRDIHQQQLAWEELRKKEEANSLIMNAALDAIVCTDLDGKVVFWNSHSEKIFGWLAIEAIGRDMKDLIIPERFRSLHQKGMDRYLQTGEEKVLNRPMLIDALRRDGSEFPVEISIIHLKNPGQNFFCAFIRDLSVQQAALQAIKQNDENYQLLFRNMSLGVIEVDREERIVHVNQVMEEMTGYSREEMLGRVASELLLDTGKQKEAMQDVNQSRMKGTSSSYEMKVRKKSGEMALWMISGAPLYNPDGSIRGSVGIHWDITDIQKI